MAEPIVSSVLTRIGDLLVQESNFLYGVSDQVELLQTELKLMQGLLKDADARQDESDILRQWVAETRDLAYDAEDIIATYALKVASRKEGGVLKRCTCILYEGITVHKVGSQIVNIRAKISILKTSFRDYGIRESIMQGGRSGSLNERQREQRETYSYLEDDVVGFDNDVKKLVEFLLKEEEGNRIASICGMGGLGKTTLAKMVYNHQRVERHFDCRAWIYVSQQCQKRHVWEEIFISLQYSKDRRDEIKKMSNAELVEELRQVQQKQKCLVILDDIWTIEAWNSLCEAFPKKNTSSKILLSSRNKDVSLHADPRGFHYELQHLNDKWSLELLEKIISHRKDPDSISKTRMEKLGKEMIGYCGGLPLAITILGGLLAAKQTQEDWENVLRYVKSHKENFGVNKVFAFSYNDLPCHLKPCFLCLGHFLKGFEIRSKELIRMWMAEGFIPQIQHGGDGEDAVEDEGERYLQELVQRCMVQVGKIGSLGRIKTCRIHDLMHDFCIAKAQRENFLLITNIRSLGLSEKHFGKIRRLAINWKSSDECLQGIKLKKYPYLRSLLFSVPHLNHVYVKDLCFKNFKLLRVLNLDNYTRNLPEDIGLLIHLKFLSIKNSTMTSLPSSLGNLRCLQTLDLRYHEMSVPNVFKKMEQLRHLYLPSKYKVSEKLELANLCYLQTLENVQPKTIQMATSFKLNCLRVLGVWRYYKEPAQDAIQIVTSCPHIHKLSLRMIINKLLEVHQFSPNLAKLTLRNTRLNVDPMATFENLPHLKILRLLHKTFLGDTMVCSKGGFPLLQSLVICRLDKLKEWRVEKGAMPSLCRLEIVACMCLNTIPDALRFIKNLRELEISWMLKSFKDRLIKGGTDFYKVQHVPSLVFQWCIL